MESCSICYEEKPLIVLHASCKFCAECALEWLKTFATNNKVIDIDSKVACPTQKCPGGQQTMKMLSTNLPSTYKDQLNDIIFRNYLMKKSDILHCSNPSCDYAGMTSASHFGCRVPFHCESCGQDWTHPIVGGTSDKKWPRFKTYITKTLSTKRCPHCQTYITKAGGCDIVTCTACRKAFAWGSVFHPQLFVLFLFIFIPAFIVICCFYQQMTDRAENDKGMKAGIWIIQILLFHTFAYILIRFIKVIKRVLDKKIKFLLLYIVVFTLILAVPIACLIGLNKLLPLYYNYWLQIVGYDLGIIGLVFALAFIYLVVKANVGILKEKRQRKKLAAKLRNNVKEQIQQNNNEKAIENKKDLEVQRNGLPTQQ